MKHVIVILALMIFGIPAFVLGYIYEIIRSGFTTGQNQLLPDAVAADDKVTELLKKKEAHE